MNRYPFREYNRSHLQGEGIFDDVIGFFSKRVGFNNISTETLEDYGKCKILNIKLARQPIQGILDSVINVLSFGKWEDLKEKYGFDKLMHLGMIFTVKTPNGNKDIMCEKVDAVTISPKISMVGANVEYLNVPLAFGLNNIDTMLYRARQAVGDNTFFDYDPFKNNCQFFIKYILEASHMYTQQAKDFLFQDVSELSKEMPSFTKTVMKGITDLGQIANKVRGASLHAVVISKVIPIEEAEEIAKEHIKGKKGFMRETGKSYRFRNIPKTKFKKGSFRTKKINKNVSLIFGELI